MVLLAALPSLGAGGENPEGPLESWTHLWFFRFLVNAAGYASFMVPGYLLVQYFRRKNYLETGVWGKGGEVCSVCITSVGQQCKGEVAASRAGWQLWGR